MIKFTTVTFISSLASRTFHFHNEMKSVDGSCLNYLSLRWGLHVHHQCISSFFTIFRLHCLWRITYISIKGGVTIFRPIFSSLFFIRLTCYILRMQSQTRISIFFLKGGCMCRHVQKVFGYNGSVVNADELTV